MGIELGPGALDPIPEVLASIEPAKEISSERRQEIEANKAAAKARKAERYRRFREVRAAKGYARSQARLYRLAHPDQYPSRYAQNLQATYAASTSAWMRRMYPNRYRQPSCQARRSNYYR